MGSEIILSLSGLFFARESALKITNIHVIMLTNLHWIFFLDLKQCLQSSRDGKYISRMCAAMSLPQWQPRTAPLSS